MPIVKRAWFLLLFVGLGLLLVSLPHLVLQPSPSLLSSPHPPIALSVAATPEPVSQVEYQTYALPSSTVHVLRVPADSGFRVVPGVAEAAELVTHFAEAAGAIAAVNGGFFDPVNQQTTSYIVLEGAVVADPAQNERLVNNPDMIPYLAQILNRSEFRQYQCPEGIRYGITRHDHPAPTGCQISTALGAGPRLLPTLDLETEAFTEVVNGTVVRDALGSDQPNARTAVGITAEGDILLVVAAQLPEAPTNSGLSLTELAEFLGNLNAVQAMNLDGGSSSTLYYQGQTHYGRLDATGNPVERSVKSVLLVLEG